MSEPNSPAVPEGLLGPLLDAAAEYLRDSDPLDAPTSLRPLIGFDHRGLVRGVARHQMLQTIEHDEDFRKKAVERFLERPVVDSILNTWNVSNAPQRAFDAADRGDLPLLASALYAARPKGWSFGLGIAVAAFELTRQEKAERSDADAMAMQIESARGEAEQAEQAWVESEQRAEDLARELREEQRARRSTEMDAQQKVAAADGKASSMQQTIDQLRARIAELDQRSERERVRTREMNDEIAELRKKLRRATEELEGDGAGLRQRDLQQIVDAADLARRLGSGLSNAVDRIKRAAPRSAEPVSANPRTQQRSEAAAPRRKPSIPGGLALNTTEGVLACLSIPGIVLVVDGYNVSIRGWSSVPRGEQREGLAIALGNLHQRTHCPVTLVFDGADVGAVRPLHRSGVQMIFSEVGEEADVVVVREVGAIPSETPVVVASSDSWIREQADRLGARTISADALMSVLRP